MREARTIVAAVTLVHPVIDCATAELNRERRVGGTIIAVRPPEKEFIAAGVAHLDVKSRAAIGATWVGITKIGIVGNAATCALLARAPIARLDGKRRMGIVHDDSIRRRGLADGGRYRGRHVAHRRGALERVTIEQPMTIPSIITRTPNSENRFFMTNLLQRIWSMLRRWKKRNRRCPAGGDIGEIFQ